MSKVHLHSIYTISALYLHNIYVQPTLTSGCSGPSSLGPRGQCSSPSSTTRPRSSHSPPSRRGRTAHSSRVSNTKLDNILFSKWECGLGNDNCLNANKYFYSDFPWFNCCGIVLQILYWILVEDCVSRENKIIKVAHWAKWPAEYYESRKHANYPGNNNLVLFLGSQISDIILFVAFFVDFLTDEKLWVE